MDGINKHRHQRRKWLMYGKIRRRSDYFNGELMHYINFSHDGLQRYSKGIKTNNDKKVIDIIFLSL